MSIAPAVGANWTFYPIRTKVQKDLDIAVQGTHENDSRCTSMYSPRTWYSYIQDLPTAMFFGHASPPTTPKSRASQTRIALLVEENARPDGTILGPS